MKRWCYFQLNVPCFVDAPWEVSPFLRSAWEWSVGRGEVGRTDGGEGGETVVSRWCSLLAYHRWQMTE